MILQQFFKTERFHFEVRIIIIKCRIFVKFALSQQFVNAKIFFLIKSDYTNASFLSRKSQFLFPVIFLFNAFPVFREHRTNLLVY